MLQLIHCMFSLFVTFVKYVQSNCIALLFDNGIVYINIRYPLLLDIRSVQICIYLLTYTIDR